jgi:L-fuconolactonase
VGVRHVAQAEPDHFLAQDDVVRGISRLGRLGLTYDILVFERQLPAALDLTSRLPDQAFVVDHLAKPLIKAGGLEPWATHLRELARRPNICCKISGLVTEADWTRWRLEHLRPYLDVAFDAFGPDRVMFGSDWPVCLIAAAYDRVVGVIDDYAASLSASERAGLFGGNAARFYGLT